MGTCHILKSICLACGEPFSTKLKLCRKGVEGLVCLKMDVSIGKKVRVGTDTDGRRYVDLTEILEVVVVKNRNPLCSCGESMTVPSLRDVRGTEDEPTGPLSHLDMEVDAEV